MKKHFINIAWAFSAMPFYLLILICCIYSLCLSILFNRIGEKVEVWRWIDNLDSWVYNMKSKWL